MTVNQINRESTYGRLLFSAIAILMAEKFTDLTGDQVLEKIISLANLTTPSIPAQANMVNFQLQGDLAAFEEKYINQFTQMGIEYDVSVALLSSIWVFVNNQWALPEGVSQENGFVKRLEQLINMHSLENKSDTPDFILAEYLNNCLSIWNEMTNKRDTFQGRGSVTNEYQNTFDFEKVLGEPK